MRLSVLLAMLACVAASAQNQNTAVYPSDAPGDSDLLVAKDLSESTLSASITPTDTSITVAAGSRFAGYEVVVIGDEQIQICSVAGNTLTVCAGGRGFGGTSAVSHSAGAAVRGVMVAHHHNQLAAEVKALARYGNRVGTTLPTTCSVGETFFDSDATAGQNIYGCTAADTWTLEGGGGGGGGAPTGASYLVLSADATLTAERIFTPGSGIAGSDGGANGNYTVSVDSASVPFLALNNAFLGNNSWAGATAYTPSAVQTLTATDAIDVANVSYKQISAASAITLTSTPTIADGAQDGRWIYIVNVGSYGITIQDEAQLAGSNLCLLGDANQTIPANGGAIMLSWNSTLSCWVQLGAITSGSGGGSSKSVVITQVTDAVPGNTTEYFGISGSLTGYGTQTERTVAFPIAGTLGDARLRTSTAQPAAGSLTCTLRKNGAPTAISITVPAGATAGQYTDSDTVTVDVGSEFVWVCSNGATTASATITSLALSFQP